MMTCYFGVRRRGTLVADQKLRGLEQAQGFICVIRQEKFPRMLDTPHKSDLIVESYRT